MKQIENCSECWNMLSYCIWCENWYKAGEICQTLQEIKSQSKFTYIIGRLLRFFFI